MKKVALIFAGGTGERMKTKSIPKQFLIIHSKPIIIHTLEVFEKTQSIDAIVIVMLKDKIEYTRELTQKFDIKKVVDVVEGGQTGQESIYNGLNKIHEKFGGDCVVLIHDGVRPLIDSSLLDANIETVLRDGNAISSVPCTETILLKDNKNKFDKTVDRSSAYLGRAPQSFVLKDIFAAHNKARQDGLSFIDSATLMNHYGHKLSFVECKRSNIKVTTQEDCKLLRAYLDINEDAQFYE